MRYVFFGLALFFAALCGVYALVGADDASMFFAFASAAALLATKRGW